MNDKDQLNDIRLVAGLLREAMFYSRRVTISQSGLDFETLIDDIEEASTRSETEEKKGYLTPLNLEHELNQHHEFNFKCSFPQFVIQWSGLLNRTDDGRLVFAVPSVVNVINHRSNARVSALEGQVLSGPILVQTEGLHSKAHLTIEDFSRDGLGGALVTASGVPISFGTRLYGQIQSQNGIIIVNGKIVQAQVQEHSTTHFGEASYRVGVILLDRIESGSVHRPANNTMEDRRKAKRVEAQMDLSVMSPFNPKHEISMSVADASVTGFSARLHDVSDRHIMPVAVSYPIIGSSLCAELVAYSDKLLHFQLISGNSDDRLSWTKRLSKFQGINFSTRLSVGNELVQLFCNSGALSAQYIKGQMKIAGEFSDSFTMDADQPPWLHRWVERTQDGEIKGHVSAARFGDSLWHLGDVSGMVEESRKISKEFIPGFFANFKEYCRSIEPCPHLLITWIEGHPYWKRFNEYLETDGKAHVRCRIKTRYHRIQRGAVAHYQSNDNWIATKISGGQYELVESIQKEIQTPEALPILRSLDFDPWTFGSRSLRTSVAATKREFRREYFLFSDKKSRFLVIFQSFPLGTSALKTEDVPWIFPLAPTQFQSVDWESLRARVWTLALSMGFDFPGVIEVMPTDLATDPKAAKSLIWTLAHPDAFSFFEREYGKK